MGKWIIAGIAVVLLVMGITSFNNISTLSIEADKTVANVNVQLKRRADLIPNLVATVKAEANFEKSTLEAVVNARSRATGITLTPEMLNNPEAMKKFNQAQGDFNLALSRLLVASENYPNLKSNEAFKGLRAELAGSENRVGVARQRLNEAVGFYNTAIATFPGALVNVLMGRKPKAFFEIDEASKEAPKVTF